MRSHNHIGFTKIVVYFDQQTGDPHAVRWPKYFFWHLSVFLVIFGALFFPFVTEKDGKTCFSAKK